ncbi:MAG: NAD(P)/FAD-dependent oxidoreductase [Opitutaceae bacterium]|nr:NAD(P)/FAD-dependent oxidoreductase [Cephaloticoccus sp.]MCP5530171.1 NAD(P)/FAD-dependent oxidoreductase [Opitutaceae bacterium]
MNRTAGTKLPRVVVIGGGFAGVHVVKSIPPGEAEITLIDRQNHHLFQPLLYQVATAALSAVDIAQPIRAIFGDRPNLSVVMAEVTDIDLNAKRVTHTRGQADYDYLVVAAGSQTSYYANPQWEALAPGLKSLDDALRIRRKILTCFEKAETEPDPQRKAELLTMVIVGAGPTGVELAGSLADLSRRVLRKDFDHIDPASAKVILVSSGPRVLETFTEEMSVSAKTQLEQLGVEVWTGVRAEAIDGGTVTVGGRTVRAGIVIWAAGVSANPLGRKLGAETDRGGRVLVKPDLSLPGHPEAFVVGDLAALTDVNGIKVPGVAQAALQMGGHVGRIITHECRVSRDAAEPRPRPGYAYIDKGSMATIGRSAAVAELGRIKLQGWFAWVAWLGVHLLFLVGFRNKASVLLSWAYSYFTYKRGARIITGISGENSAGSA